MPKAGKTHNPILPMEVKEGSGPFPNSRFLDWPGFGLWKNANPAKKTKKQTRRAAGSSCLVLLLGFLLRTGLRAIQGAQLAQHCDLYLRRFFLSFCSSFFSRANDNSLANMKIPWWFGVSYIALCEHHQNERPRFSWHAWSRGILWQHCLSNLPARSKNCSSARVCMTSRGSSS